MSEPFAPIVAVIDHGSIVQVNLRDDEGPRRQTRTVWFDHRPFGWLLQDRAGGDVDALIGQRARRVYAGDPSEHILTLEFEE